MIALALLLAQPDAWMPTGKWRVYGEGNVSCGAWTMHKDDQAYRLSQLSWVGGFLSGINIAAGGKVTETDVQSLTLYIDQQCAEKPLAQASEIALIYYYKLRNQ